MSDNKHPTLLAHITGLDGLRAIAIAAVTLFHLFPNQIKGGYLGVSLFFMLSGFLLTYSSERRCYKSNMSARKFYLNRIRRIYPPLIIVAVVTIGTLYFVSPESLGGMRKEAFSIFFGYNNWWQIAQNADYFTRISGISPFTPIWSLAIELQFYLIWPLLYVIYLFLRVKKNEKSALMFLGILTILSFIYLPVRFLLGGNITRLYYGTDTRIHALLLGSLIGFEYVHPQLRKRPHKYFKPKLCYGICWGIVILACLFLDGQYNITYTFGLIGMAIVFACIVRLTAQKDLPFTHHMEAKPLKWIGDRSYEIYLWQYPVLFLFTEVGLNELPCYRLLIIVIVVVLADLTHRFISYITDHSQPNRLKDLVSLKMQSAQLNYQRVASVILCIFIVCGCLGLASAPAEKNSDTTQLKETLAKSSKYLKEETKDKQDSSLEDTPSETKPSNVDVSKLDYSTTSNSAYVSKEGIAMVGDSVMLACALPLEEAFPDSTIDAAESRSVPEGVSIVKELKKKGKLKHTLVLGFGTNGIISDAKAKELFDIIPDDISVFWINVHGNKLTWTKDNNNKLQQLAKEHKNLTVIDWDTPAKSHESWLYNDGIHPNTKGAKQYANLLTQTMDKVIAEQEAVQAK